MPKELKNVFLEGMDVSVESFIRSRPSESEPYLISAAFECLRQHAPMCFFFFHFFFFFLK